MPPSILAVSGIAHDLNNQIMILMNSLDQLARNRPATPELYMALQAARHCAHLVDQLTPDPITDQAVCLSLRELAGDIAAQVRALLPSYNRLEVECAVEGRILASPTLVQQALLNVCLNAIQAMDGPGILRLVIAREPGFAAVSISDTGPGVPADLRERIFDPLFTTRSSRGGKGLGLARVRATIWQLGGTVTVHDVLPHGALFRIRLPLATPSIKVEFADLSD